MRKLQARHMEKIQGGDTPKWLQCATAAGATALFFGSILSGNVAAAILGPTIVGAAWGNCLE